MTLTMESSTHTHTHTPFNGSTQATDNKVVQQAKSSFTIYVDEALKSCPLNGMQISIN